MSDVFFRELLLPSPHYELDVGSGPHGEQTGLMLARIERVLQNEAPDWVAVYGDTNSTLAGALAAAKLHIPLAHVEAGLRSFDRMMPEEINRVLTDHASDLLLAPTSTAVSNLQREGICDNRVRLVGDVMFDTALFFAAMAERGGHILGRMGIRPKSYILCTVHRAENTDDRSRLEAIFRGLCRVAQRVPVIAPLHPRTLKSLRSSALLESVSQSLSILEPVGYLDMVTLEKNARLIVTDSGGVQKEAFFYEVPCVTLRDETEWIELVELGWNRLVPPLSVEAVEEGVLAAKGTTGRREKPYGNGDAAGKIVKALEEFSSRPH